MIQANDPHSRALLGRLVTPHGQVETPVFMPIGTAGSVEGMMQYAPRYGGSYGRSARASR